MVSLASAYTHERTMADNSGRRGLAWTEPMQELLTEVGKKLFNDASHQDNINLIIGETLAQFVQVAPSLSKAQWLRLIEQYKDNYEANKDRPSHKKAVYLPIQKREYIQTIGNSMAAVQSKWPKFILIRRQRRHSRADTSQPAQSIPAYSALPIIIFSLLWQLKH